MHCRSGLFLVLTCKSAPSASGNGSMTLPEIPWVEGSVIQYRCQTGYKVKESISVRVCALYGDSGKTLRWSPNEITCVPGKINAKQISELHVCSSSDETLRILLYSLKVRLHGKSNFRGKRARCH